MNKTSIEWTHRPETRGADGGRTWNPIRARLKGIIVDNDGRDANGTKVTGTFCTRISPGCTHCYASAINKRFGNGLDYTVPNLENVEFFLDEKILQEPLKARKPCTIFVGDMFDLFHEAITSEMIAQVFAVIALCQDHVFQLLTKRAERMYDVFQSAPFWEEVATQAEAIGYTISPCIGHRVDEIREGEGFPWKYLWLGVSVESQKYADERIPLLLQTPAAVRFLSVEPQLEAVHVEKFLDPLYRLDTFYRDQVERGMFNEHQVESLKVKGIHQVICGGESGPGARPFNLAWAESLREQCKAAGTAYFCKQLGSNPQVHSCRDETCTHPDCGMERIKLKDRKGGDPSEWPESLRVREFPAVS